MPPLETTGKRTPAFDGKRLQLLDAAARVFCEVGYHKATMRRIAAAAQVSLAGIYHYVASKEELLYSIQRHTFDALLRGLRSSLEGVSGPQQRLGAAVRNHVRHSGDNMCALKVCAREIETLEGEVRVDVQERRRSYFEAVRELIEALGPRRGGSRESWLATANLFGMLNWFDQWYDSERTRVGLDELAAQQTALFFEGYIATTSSDESRENR